MMAHEIIADDYSGKTVSLGVFDSPEFAASARDVYMRECGDEYRKIVIRETDDDELVIMDPGEPANDCQCPVCGLPLHG